MKKIFYTFLLISPLLFLPSCEDENIVNEESQVSSPLFVGMEAYGGIIFYLDDSEQHGLVIATDDLLTSNDSIGFPWDCDSLSWYEANSNEGWLGDTNIGGNGQLNTTNIVSSQNCQVITAAQAADQYEIDDYDDWFLPSSGEMNLAYLNLWFNPVNEMQENGLSQTEIYLSVYEGLNGFDWSDNGKNYWTSTEVSNNISCHMMWGNGIGYSNKLIHLRVRPIRSF
jgi:hypothetical protein